LHRYQEKRRRWKERCDGVRKPEETVDRETDIKRFKLTAQSVLPRATRFDSGAGERDFSLLYSVQTGS
jgi:hypothetical protein